MDFHSLIAIALALPYQMLEQVMLLLVLCLLLRVPFSGGDWETMGVEEYDLELDRDTVDTDKVNCSRLLEQEVRDKLHF